MLTERQKTPEELIAETEAFHQRQAQEHLRVFKEIGQLGGGKAIGVLGAGYDWSISILQLVSGSKLWVDKGVKKMGVVQIGYPHGEMGISYTFEEVPVSLIVPDFFTEGLMFATLLNEENFTSKYDVIFPTKQGREQVSLTVSWEKGSNRKVRGVKYKCSEWCTSGVLRETRTREGQLIRDKA